MATAVPAILVVALIGVLSWCSFLIKWWQRHQSRRLPPGSLGFPFIGQSLGFLRAMRSNTAEEWMERRIRKYGPVSKMSLLGRPTVLLTAGQAANKFIFANEPGALGLHQPSSAKKVLGERNLLEMVGDEHKRVRGALGAFLKQDVLKKSVEAMDFEVRQHVQENWDGKETVKVLPLAKKLTFDIMCSLLFGIERGVLRETLVHEFDIMVEGLWSVPINIPFSRYSKSLAASKRIRSLLLEIIQKKRVSVNGDGHLLEKDLLTHLINIGRSDCNITDAEIIDNSLVLMSAGFDTSSILITFMLRHLAKNPKTYESVLNEQEEISKSKINSDQPLTWDDISRMKHTWCVAMEVLRLVPPIFGNFRRALKDLEFEGYSIPKGWQVFWVANFTHMDANIFPEPLKFDHARFENPSTIPPYCFVAFGAGRRICPGIDFARIETLIAMHYLVTKF